MSISNKINVMDFTKFLVSQDDDNRRLDKIIRLILPQKGLGEIYTLIRKGLIKVNDKKAKQDQKVFVDDEITVAKFLVENQSQTKQKTNQSEVKLPPVVFKNDHIIILNKPYNVTVHGKDDSLDAKVKKYFQATSGKTSLSFAPGPLHRLDKKTTGLLAFSWSIDGARWFSQNIETHAIQKYYLGVISGTLAQKETWENTIEKETPTSTASFHTVQESSSGKKAITYVTPIKYGKYKGHPITLAEFHIVTGRTHQIRFQSASHGYPLLGDTAYNGKAISEKQDFFLHAYKLTLPENPLELPEEITCPQNRDFEDFCKKYF